jgi:hypothetical protein
MHAYLSRALLLLASAFLGMTVLSACQSMPGSGEAAFSGAAGSDQEAMARQDAAAIMAGMQRANAQSITLERAIP